MSEKPRVAVFCKTWPDCLVRANEIAGEFGGAFDHLFGILSTRVKDYWFITDYRTRMDTDFAELQWQPGVDEAGVEMLSSRVRQRV